MWPIVIPLQYYAMIVCVSHWSCVVLPADWITCECQCICCSFVSDTPANLIIHIVDHHQVFFTASVEMILPYIIIFWLGLRGCTFIRKCHSITSFSHLGLNQKTIYFLLQQTTLPCGSVTLPLNQQWAHWRTMKPQSVLSEPPLGGVQMCSHLFSFTCILYDYRYRVDCGFTVRPCDMRSNEKEFWRRWLPKLVNLTAADALNC